MILEIDAISPRNKGFMLRFLFIKLRVPGIYLSSGMILENTQVIGLQRFLFAKLNKRPNLCLNLSSE
jgi:hypothetical protein